MPQRSSPATQEPVGTSARSAWGWRRRWSIDEETKSMISKSDSVDESGNSSQGRPQAMARDPHPTLALPSSLIPHPSPCLLYTSDAADEEDSVDLGGRRIIKKKKNE
eukprot:TRINITY_DN6812_c0_g1_i2.p1 TRINITY_DN6812_c0_g1~~TRINITY_DN6812_c0_g1_i2.p1  ORF type:complete len:107 (+),score=23.66 TRINITY_DN6812_c0_g1_i2:75-395(+)